MAYKIKKCLSNGTKNISNNAFKISKMPPTVPRKARILLTYLC